MGSATGKPEGKSPAKPSELVAEFFGFTFNIRPFFAVEKGMNIVKGKIFELYDPVVVDKLDDLAADTVEADIDEAADAMLLTL